MEAKIGNTLSGRFQPPVSIAGGIFYLNIRKVSKTSCELILL
jgi:hypothetical protein